MKEILDLMRESSKRLQDPMQIKVLREIIEPSFKELIEHTENMYSALEKRVYDEIINKENQFEIFTTLIPRKDLNYQSLYLSPILEEDREAPNLKDILKNLKNGETAVVDKLFCPLSDKKIEELLSGNKEYEGYLVEGSKRCKIKVALELVNEYEKKEEMIYKLFYKNNLPWRTINNPYTRKIIQVVVVKILGDIDEIEEIETIEFNDLNFSYEKDMVPVWNILEKIHTVTSGIDPAEDNINYNYTLFSEELKEIENQILPYNEDANIKAIFRSEDGELKIVCDAENIVKWNIFVFKNLENYKIDDNKYIIFRNNEGSSFDKFRRKNNAVIRTKGEIIRLVELHGKKFGIQVSKIETNDRVYGEETPLNSFIKDEIRVGNIDKYLLVYFTVLTKDYLSQNIIDFILAELQLFMSDFQCRGVVL